MTQKGKKTKVDMEKKTQSTKDYSTKDYSKRAKSTDTQFYETNSMENQSNRTRKKGSKTSLKHKIGWAFLVSFLILSVILLIIGLLFYGKYGEKLIKYQKEAKQLVSSSTLDTFRQMETSLVYDNKDKLISVVKGEKDVYYLDFDKIPDYAKEAMISIEDKKFLTHEGVDGQAIIRAAIALIKNEGSVTQGASTITQQLARNIFLSNEVTWERKLKEMFIAIELEKKYNKEQIMEFYLNNIYFANGYYGIEAASQGYFSKSSNKLSLSEIAFLCAIPNNPTMYDPITNADNTIERRNRILMQMYNDGVISKKEYTNAQKEEIEIVQKKLTKNNYVDTYVFYNATRALMEEYGFEFKNVFENEADRLQYEKEYQDLYYHFQKSLFYEGYRIYTSIDIDKQQLLQKTVDETLADYKEVNGDGTYTLQSGAVSIDNSTGHVIAIVGGRFQETSGYTLNRGYQSYRQPGSVIKPLIVYTPSFERGYYPENIVNDKPVEGGPANSGGSYSGKISLRRAIEMSKNTIAWKLFEELTPEVGLSYLLDMNFAKIDQKDYYSAASLGGFTVGVSPLEITAGYAALENDGIYREPTCIIKILDAEGKEIVGESNTPKRVYDKNAARMMTNTLTGVLTNGTGKGLSLDDMSAVGKTGTTDDNKDGWFVGYTPYYTTGVWVGYDMPKTLGNLYGATLPGTIWKNFMNTIHKGLKNIQFPAYDHNKPGKETTGAAEETTAEETTVNKTTTTNKTETNTSSTTANQNETQKSESAESESQKETDNFYDNDSQTGMEDNSTSALDTWTDGAGEIDTGETDTGDNLWSDDQTWNGEESVQE